MILGISNARIRKPDSFGELEVEFFIRGTRNGVLCNQRNEVKPQKVVVATLILVLIKALNI